MKFLKESIIFCLLNLTSFLVRILPLRIVYVVCDLCGWLGYFFAGKQRRQVYINLKIAFGSEKSPEELKLLVRKTFSAFAKNCIDFLRVPSLVKMPDHKWVEFDGREHIKEGLKNGNGLMFVAMHFGCWELASVSAGLLGNPYHVIANPQGGTKQEKFLNTYRSYAGKIIFSKGMSTRGFIKALKDNETVGVVTDQGGKTGMLIPFFGKTTSMAIGAVRMALKYNSAICFSSITRIGSSHKVSFHPLSLIRTGDEEKDIYENLKQIVSFMEKYIRLYPEEYMWFYKVWKYSDQAKIIVLSDKKPGHYKQSLAIAHKLQRVMAEARKINGSVELIEVAFKSLWHGRVFSVLTRVFRKFIKTGDFYYIRSFLTKESYEKLSRISADYVISCGSSLSAMNIWLSNETGAKNIAIQKPGFQSFNDFKLILLPQHDSKFSSPSKNVFLTKVSPNEISDLYLTQQSESLKKRFSLSKNNCKKIGVFVGGNSKNSYIDEYIAHTLIDQLKKTSEYLNAEVLLTTSRRTSESVDKCFEAGLSDHSLCPILIIANKLNFPEAAAGIMGLADVIVVSGDSISMISEAVSTKKPVIVFSPIFKTKKTKHERFVQYLADQKIVKYVNIKDVASAINDITGDQNLAELDDDQKIQEKLNTLL